jgi:hypothetical protein
MTMLDLTDHQKSGLHGIGVDTGGKALEASEAEFRQI